MKKLLITSVLALLTGAAHADLQLDNFSNLQAESPTFDASWSFGSFDQYIQNNGFISITSVTGGDPKDDGSFIVSNDPFDIAGLTLVSISAKVDAGNFASGFNLTFYDDNFNTANAAFAAASFNANFNTVTSPISFGGGFDPANVIAWQINGGNFAPANDFRMSFDQINVLTVPEPGAGTLMLLGSALAFLWPWLRRLARSREDGKRGTAS